MKVVKVQIQNDEKPESVISNSDIFYGEIYIDTDHLEAWAKEYNNLPMKEMSLIEEMSELTQAISKYYRNIDFTKRDDCVNAIKEEMAHVLISLKGLAWGIGIRPEDIQAEIEKKWPAAYENKLAGCREGEYPFCVWTEPRYDGEGIAPFCTHMERPDVTWASDNTCLGCKYFVKKKEEK